MTERPKVSDSKSDVVQATGGSNPPLSSIKQNRYAHDARDGS